MECTRMLITQNKPKITTKRPKTRKQKATVITMYTRHLLDLIHIPIKFHEDIPYGYRVMGRTRILWENMENKKSKGHNLETKKRYTHSCATRRFYLIHIPIKFHEDIGNGYGVYKNENYTK